MIVADTPDLSEEEEVRFAICYENGYDLKHDDQYNQWLTHRHPSVPLNHHLLISLISPQILMQVLKQKLHHLDPSHLAITLRMIIQSMVRYKIYLMH